MNSFVRTLAVPQRTSVDYRLFALLSMAAIWISSSISYGQTGDDALRFALRAPGFSTISMGMSGTGIAGVSDGSAFATNPAGLGWAKNSYVNVALSNLRTKDAGIFNSPNYSSSLDHDVSATGLGSLSYLGIIPTTRGAMVIGAAINQVSTFERGLLYDGENGFNSLTDYLMPLSNEFTLNTDADGTYPEFTRGLSLIAFETYAIDLDQDKLDAGSSVPFTPAVTAGTTRQSGVVSETGQMTEINVGGAIEVAPEVMFGASINVPFGTYSFFRELDESDIYNDNDGNNGTTDFDRLLFTERVTSDVVGINLSLGLSAKINPYATVGLSLQTPTHYSVDDSYSTVLATSFDNGDSFRYGGGSRDSGTGTFAYSINTPWKMGVGGAYEFAGARISADLEFVDWSQMEMDSDSYTFEFENQDISRGLDAVTNVRLGLSYDVSEKLELRGGYALYPDPHASTANSEGVSVDRERTFFSAGLGYTVKENIRVDFAWMNESFEDLYQVYTEVADAPYVSEDVTRNRFQFGISFGL
jgi:hypothetical protein